LRGVGAARLANPEEFHNVHAALPEFQAADEAVFAAKFPGQLPLGQAGVLAQFYEGLADTLALLGVDRFVHARMLRAGYCCFQNAGRRILAVPRVAWGWVAGSGGRGAGPK
jgi:hypothetical protein